MFGKFNKVLLGVALIGGVTSGSCSVSEDSGRASQFLSPTSGQIKLVSPRGVARLPRESQQNLLSTAIGCFSDSEFLGAYLAPMSESERGTFLSESLSMWVNIMAQMGRYGLQFMVRAEPTHLLQQRIESEEREPMDMQAEMKVAKDPSQLDDDTISRIERAVHPETMREIASRHASDSSNVLLIGRYVEELLTSSSPRLFGKLKTIVERLLRDESPNKEWILSLISELNSEEQIRVFYNELATLIQR